MSSTRDNRTAFSFPFPFPVPFASPAAVQPFWALMESSVARVEPVAKCAVTTQLNAVAFVGSRARAQLDLASKLAGCRTPQAAMEATTAFWQDAARQYMGFGKDCANAWRGMFSAALTPLPAAGPIRDLLTLPDAIVAEQPDPVRTTAGAIRRAA